MHAARDSPEVERLIEHALDQLGSFSLGAGGSAQLEALASTLSDPAARARFLARALAHEYLARAADGSGGALGDYLARLPDAAQRELFHEVLRDAELARQRLPGELVPGACLDGRYEIRSEVGRGGMGVVYAALDRELEREVAVKVLRLPPGAGGESGWQELFQRESKTLARLESPNIVAIHDARFGRERSYIVMDLVRGKDLLRILGEVREERLRLGCAARSPEPLRRAVGRPVDGARADLVREPTHARCVARIVRAIAATLERAHQAGVIHRDLKPQNVVLVPGGEPVLLDFGLASVGQEGLEEGFRGTPEYMAPEQIESLRAGDDPRTDVYQLGLLLYELLALRRAFVRPASMRNDEDDVLPLFERIRAGAAPPLGEVATHVPRALAAIVRQAMLREPARRYASVRELREDLDRFLVRLPPRTAELAPARKLWMWCAHAARRPLAAVVPALGLAAYLWLRESPWVPPDLDVLLRAPDGTVARLEPNERIELAGKCSLGLDVTAEDRTWLYVFSVFGGPTAPTQFLTLAEPMPLEDAFADPAQRTPGRIELAAGRHELACTVLARPDAPDAWEGLLVFASAEPSALLEQWQASLLELEDATGVRTPYDDAIRLGETLSEGLRGERISSLSAEERARLFGSALAAERGAADSLRARGLRRYDFLFPVQAASAGAAAR